MGAIGRGGPVWIDKIFAVAVTGEPKGLHGMSWGDWGRRGNWVENSRAAGPNIPHATQYTESAFG